MKKTLAVLMALTMLLALCIPAFAADKVIDQTTAQTGQGEVKVLGSTATENYTVTFPATTEITWGQNAELTYQVRCQLQSANRLKVTVAPSSDSTNAKAFLKSAENDQILYTLGGEMALTTATNNIPADEAHNLSVTVAAEEWAKAPLKDYNDFLTFDVAVVPAV